MKKMSMGEITKKVKEEYKAGRQWCESGFGRYYKMMIDTSDGRIWCDCFLSENDWNKYHSETITPLNYTPGYVSDTESGYISDAIHLLDKAGWIITN